MRRKLRWGMAASLAGFAILLAVFCSWLDSFRQDNRQRQYEALETALNRSVLLCYTLEGRYPEDLSELLEKYPLTYDAERFYIDYRLQGGNILPEITILEIS